MYCSFSRNVVLSGLICLFLLFIQKNNSTHSHFIYLFNTTPTGRKGHLQDVRQLVLPRHLWCVRIDVRFVTVGLFIFYFSPARGHLIAFAARSNPPTIINFQQHPFFKVTSWSRRASHSRCLGAASDSSTTRAAFPSAAIHTSSLSATLALAKARWVRVYVS